MLLRLGFAVLVSSLVLFGRGVPAGTLITNVAEMTYEMNGNSYSVVSNVHTDRVDQLIELAIECQETDFVPARPGEQSVVATFVLGNTGNGDDAFELVAESNNSLEGIENPIVYVDNGDGVFAESDDLRLNEVNLTADGNVTLHLVFDVAQNVSWQSVGIGIRARSKTGGSGVAGTVYDKGQYFALDGFKGGVDKALCSVMFDKLNLVLSKEATLSSPQLFIGSTIRYRITAKLEGYGTVEDIVIKDTLPPEGKYVAGSLRLDGTPLSDSAHISGTTVTVPIGSMTRTNTLETVHVIEFEMKVE